MTGYDKHGNITGLQRYGKTTASTYGLIDNLSFGYVGNRMKYVNDAVATNPVGQSFQFVNGSNSTGDEYTYDANGNMTKNLNKNITDIQYNLLNLPTKLQLSSGGVATYTYDAAGVKRKVEHQGAGENKTTDYCGNVIYENGALSKILTDEGYITLSGTTPTYHYYLKDHLGNNRVVLNQNGTTVEQVNHYYPFGGLFDQTSETLQAYKYNGKELDRTYGIDLYDYSARFMDGAVGRFTTMDPLSEKYYSVSPYGYVMNNPMRFVDPDGRKFVDSKGKDITITYHEDGTLTFSKNATQDIIRVANALNTTEAGRSQFVKMDKSDIKVKLTISPDTKKTKRADGKVAYTYGEAVQGNYNKKDNYGRKVNPDGTYGIKEASIIIYEGSIKESIEEGSGLKHEGLSLEQAIGAVAGHEGVHTTDKKEIHEDLKAEMQGKSRPDGEIKSNLVEKNIIDQYKRL